MFMPVSLIEALRRPQYDRCSVGRVERILLARYTLGHMGTLRPHPSVKLFCGLIGSDEDLLRRARQLLVKTLGPVDLASDLWPFDQTDYYAAEMGPDLKRQFLSFERRIRSDMLAQIKRETNEIEVKIAEECLLEGVSRPVNIDPGYLDLGKLVLATTKDRSHRIYIGGRIFAEVTLHFCEGCWQAWPWTYPDYKRAEYHAFFMQVRERLKEQRRQSADDSDRDDS